MFQEVNPYFILIGEWIDKFNMVYSMADYDMPRYELWQDFINTEIEEVSDV